ncbi:ATP-binding cassette domain-containing protein [Salinispora arenicola]|uniref:ATP-binding cassette domain-containing protein n=1 Tax=Salinispora arenicola TaxID=168697 RepID=UPI001E59BBD8|nr:ABC transporter ATP-binding protein [Salinispora arenicola]
MELLSHAAGGGRTLLAGYVLLVAVAAVAIAAAVGGLLSAVADATGSGSGLGSVLNPLALVAGCLVVLQAATLSAAPLGQLLEARIDGALCQEVLAAVATLPTADRVTDRELCDDLARFTTGGIAWIHSGIGAGALAQVRQMVAYAALLPGAAILSTCTWWWGPVVVMVCVVTREVDARGFLAFERVVNAHATEMRRTKHWRELIAGRTHAREVRLLGIVNWLSVRHDASLARYSASLDSVRVRLRTHQLLLLGTMITICGATYVAVGAAGATRATPLADLAMVLGVAGAMLISGDVQAAMAVETALPMASAVARLRATSARPPADQARYAALRDGDAPPLIRLRGVTFTHPGGTEPALRGLDRELRPGEVLALVGANGAGKSTVGHLIAGLYRQDKGDVTVDGVPIARVDPVLWAATVHTIHQDFARFELPITDAIRLAAPDATDRDVAAVATRTGLDRHVACFPRGWHTHIGGSHPGGVALSGGQWQCLALTRALLAVEHGTRVLVLDEATANLDSEAELALFDAVLRCRGTASVLVASHRFATVQRADRIAVIDSGRVVECGTHPDLMATDGRYARMYRMQATPHLDRLALSSDLEGAME